MNLEEKEQDTNKQSETLESIIIILFMLLSLATYEYGDKFMKYITNTSPNTSITNK